MEQYEHYKERRREGITRFANSMIHQNMVRDETESKVLYVVDKKIGISTAVGREIDPSLAREVASHSPENPDFVSLPDPDEAGTVTYHPKYSDVTAEASPGTRAELVREVIELCKESGLASAGYLTTGMVEVEIENSLGVNRSGRTSFAEFALTTIGSGSGYTTAIGYDLAQLNLKELTLEAIETAKRNVDPEEIEPGEYRVVLEPLAVDSLFRWLSYLGFSGLYYDENRSCFSGRLGQEVASPLLTIYDEPIAELPGMGFDVEGVARRKLILIENGVLKNLAYDSYSAHKVNKKSTGNAFMFQSPYGGFPFSISFLPGTTTPDAMIGSVEDGLLIKRFWYVRVISPKDGILTGMTRDGTFRIKEGRLTKPVKNLRFQISILDFLKSIGEIGNTLRLTGYGRYPHLLVDRFRITGMTG